MARHDPDRLLVLGGFKHFRRTYSRREVWAGLVVLCLLAAIALWIRERGKERPPELYGAVPLSGKLAATRSAPSGAAPAVLVASGWSETERSEFTTDNLYEKINGRADFFTSKGFERLTFVSLASDDGAATIDLELYDMGSGAGALSAFTAERAEGVSVTESATGQHYASRNALFVVQGKYYGRALGSDESPAVVAALGSIRSALEAALGAEGRPWAYDLFVDQLGLEAGVVTFVGERAFSLEFASGFWIAVAEGEAEMFVSVRSSDAVASTDAAALIEGFSSYGKPSAGDPVFVTDEFIGTIATALAHGPFIIGVRGAPSVAWATSALERLRVGLDALDEQTRARAAAAARGTGASPSTSDGLAPDGEKTVDAGAIGADNEGGLTTEESY